MAFTDVPSASAPFGADFHWRNGSFFFLCVKICVRTANTKSEMGCHAAKQRHDCAIIGNERYRHTEILGLTVNVLLQVSSGMAIELERSGGTVLSKSTIKSH